MSKDRFIHKHGYGFLFSDRTIVRELIESFVDSELAAEIDFDDFEPLIEKSYVGEDFRDFADDLLIRVRLKGREAYLYLLIEFQSTDDRFMALRLLNYVVLFYLDYLKQHPKATNLPPVFPIMLYNGKMKWKAPDEVRDLIEDHPFLSRYYPGFRYYRILENEYTIDELESIQNAVSFILLLETSAEKDLDRVVESLARAVEPESRETVDLLARWIGHLSMNDRIADEIVEEITTARNDREAKSMLVETIEKLKKRYYREGIEKGISEGVEKGIEQGIERERTEVALNMLHEGINVEQIARITGLSEEVIRQLQKQPE